MANSNPGVLDYITGRVGHKAQSHRMSEEGCPSRFAGCPLVEYNAQEAC